MLGFAKNPGCASTTSSPRAPFAATLRRLRIDREARKGQNATDHAPVIATFG